MDRVGGGVLVGDGSGVGGGSESLFVRVEVAARMQAVVDTCPERMYAAVLTLRRYFWCSKKKIQDKTLFLLFLPESLFVRIRGMN